MDSCEAPRNGGPIWATNQVKPWIHGSTDPASRATMAITREPIIKALAKAQDLIHGRLSTTRLGDVMIFIVIFCIYVYIHT
jgi:hypothetical protein